MNLGLPIEGNGLESIIGEEKRLSSKAHIVFPLGLWAQPPWAKTFNLVSAVN